MSTGKKIVRRCILTSEHLAEVRKRGRHVEVTFYAYPNPTIVNMTAVEVKNFISALLKTVNEIEDARRPS